MPRRWTSCFVFFFQAEDGIRDHCVNGVQTCALPIWFFNVSAMRTRSASERASILRIAAPRWIFTVTSLKASSPAICLFILPAVTRAITSRSLGDKIGRASCRERVLVDGGDGFDRRTE